jgi:hypothetical protein
MAFSRLVSSGLMADHEDFTPRRSGFSQRSRVFRLLTSFTGLTLIAGMI